MWVGVGVRGTSQVDALDVPTGRAILFEANAPPPHQNNNNNNKRHKVIKMQRLVATKEMFVCHYYKKYMIFLVVSLTIRNGYFPN